MYIQIYICTVSTDPSNNKDDWNISEEIVNGFARFVILNNVTDRLY